MLSLAILVKEFISERKTYTAEYGTAGTVGGTSASRISAEGDISKTAGTPLRVIIADGQDFVRAGLVSLFKRSHPEWKVVADVGTGRQALEAGKQLQPNFAVIDYGLPDCSGLHVTWRLRSHIRNLPVLILADRVGTHHIRRARRRGAKALLAKSEDTGELLSGMERVLAGEAFFSSRAVLKVEEAPEGVERRAIEDVLSDRDLEVLRLLARGYVTKDIACALELSVRTVESHRSSIYRRLAVHSKGELIRLAIEQDI